MDDYRNLFVSLLNNMEIFAHLTLRDMGKAVFPKKTQK